MDKKILAVIIVAAAIAVFVFVNQGKTVPESNFVGEPRIEAADFCYGENVSSVHVISGCGEYAKVASDVQGQPATYYRKSEGAYAGAFTCPNIPLEEQSAECKKILTSDECTKIEVC